MFKPLFCLDCGVELDEHDVDANLATWDVFKGFCSDCIENNDEPTVSSVFVWNGKVIYGE